MNNKREHIAEIEARYGMSVRIECDTTLVSPDFVIEKFKTATRVVPEATNVVTTTIVMEDEVEDTIVEETPEDEEDDVRQETIEEERPKKKRRRRRRRRGGGGNAENQSAENQNAEGVKRLRRLRSQSGREHAARRLKKHLLKQPQRQNRWSKHLSKKKSRSRAAGPVRRKQSLKPVEAAPAEDKPKRKGWWSLGR